MNKHWMETWSKLGHARPRTRREFLAMSAKGVSSYALAPGLLGIAAREAFANEEPKAKSIPFLVFDMVGGSGLPGNFLVGKQGGAEDLLKSYSQLGWNPKKAKIDRRFGAPMAGQQISKLLDGILRTSTREAQACLKMATICHQGQDDSSSNTTSALIDISRYGFESKGLPRGVGQGSSNSGGNTQSPTSVGQLKPFIVSELKDLENSIGFSLKTDPILTKGGIRLFAEKAAALASLQLRRRVECGNTADLRSATDRAFKQLIRIIDEPIQFDPAKDSQVSGIYVDADSGPSAIIYNVLKRNTGPGCIVIEGCDYHDGTQDTGDERDGTTGEWIGRAIETAYRLNQPLFFQLLTDGGVYSDDNTRIWRGDAGDKSLTVVGYFNPAGAPKLRKSQLGHYTDGQGAERSLPFGSNTSVVSHIVTANYLNILGRASEIETFIPRGSVSAENIDDHLLFV